MPFFFAYLTKIRKRLNLFIIRMRCGVLFKCALIFLRKRKKRKSEATSMFDTEMLLYSHSARYLHVPVRTAASLRKPRHQFCRPSATGLARIPPAALDGGTTGSLVSVQLLLFRQRSPRQRTFAFCSTTEISDCDTKLRLRGNEKSAFLTVSANWSWHSPTFRWVMRWIIVSYIKSVIFEKLCVTCAYAVAWPRTLRGLPRFFRVRLGPRASHRG